YRRSGQSVAQISEKKCCCCNFGKQREATKAELKGKCFKSGSTLQKLVNDAKHCFYSVN
ncbi:hypothetical protein GBAR_LOCUS19674, partial [Geodia barretti]